MKILLLGDSLFARLEGKTIPHIDYSLRENLPNLSIENWAVSGDNSFNLLKHLSIKEIPSCDWVFVFIDANDLAQHKQVFLGEYLQNLTQIVEILLVYFPAQRICLMTPSPVDETKQVYRNHRLVEYYGGIVKQVAETYHTRLLDTVLTFSKSDKHLANLLRGSMDDGLHFGSAAYRLLARAMTDIIKEAGKSCLVSCVE
ncbi:hypothetical protein D3X11_01165 [Streptococcus sp. X16XC17]|uniref:GDSL-type esterase/lipase family protein n=1 Tax=unclassified Streptococcus TaxID=2608887 RepID=UPI00066FC410|nr:MULTISPECIES: GDSL-type esterase/lipase family protein [unclassified Streptococcus]TCD46107.1 hypothetical protein D3X11_01165 [Streptococcus sp. X16XC17]